jgi:hypothetical protein
MTAPRRTLVLLLAGALGAASCKSIGPASIPVDRSDYAVAIGVSWEQQVLLNLVRVRYAEAPSFVEVTGIVGGHEFSRNVSASAGVNNSPFGDAATIGGAATLVDRPTITFAPLSGEAFVTKVLAPVPLSALFALVETGYSAEPLLNTFLRSLNGVGNHVPRAAMTLPADAEFPKLTANLQRLQDAGAIDFRIRKGDDQKIATFLIIRKAKSPEVAAAVAEMRAIMGIPGDQNEIRLVYGILPGEVGEVTASSLSMYQVLLSLSWDVEIPEADLRGTKVLSPPEGRDDLRRFVIRVKSGTSKPDDSFVAIRHRGNWFWVESGDLQSKLSLSAICLMLRALETGPGLSPVLTIPAG